MALEIERKFLIKDDGWMDSIYSISSITQYYLVIDNNRECRVRKEVTAAGLTNCYMTIKSSKSKLERKEVDLIIPGMKYHELVSEFSDENACIKKTRFTVTHNMRTYYVDKFDGGILLAELELLQLDNEESISLPDWLGEEVTGNPDFYGSKMIKPKLDEEMVFNMFMDDKVIESYIRSEISDYKPTSKTYRLDIKVGSFNNFNNALKELNYEVLDSNVYVDAEYEITFRSPVSDVIFSLVGNTLKQGCIILYQDDPGFNSAFNDYQKTR